MYFKKNVMKTGLHLLFFKDKASLQEIILKKGQKMTFF